MISNNLNISAQDDFLEVGYQKNFTTDENSFETAYEPNSNQYSNQCQFKIRLSDLKEKGWTKDSPELMDYISNRLKTLIGFDFDQTLSNVHTWHHGENTASSNLKGGNFCKEILLACSKQANLHLFISSNNYEKVIEKHLKAWEIRDFFNEIKGRESFHHLYKGDKEVTFRQVYDGMMTNCAIDENGFLDFSKPDLLIDIIGLVLVDDDANIFKFAHYGVTVVTVNAGENDVEHLDYIRDTYLTQPKIEELKSEQKVEPEIESNESEINEAEINEAEVKEVKSTPESTSPIATRLIHSLFSLPVENESAETDNVEPNMLCTII